MTEQSFSLVPFPASNIPEIKIMGSVSRQGDFLAVNYMLTGDLEKIVLPPASVHSGRQAELWKTTCFEFFVAIKDQPRYWEINLSPSGAWNIYRMDAYRRAGFREETSIQRLPFEVQGEAGTLILKATVDLSPLFQPADDLEAGVTAVIQTKRGIETYWALVHPASEPDFHRRESFILALAGQTHPLAQSALDG